MKASDLRDEDSTNINKSAVSLQIGNEEMLVLEEDASDEEIEFKTPPNTIKSSKLEKAKHQPFLMTSSGKKSLDSSLCSKQQNKTSVRKYSAKKSSVTKQKR